MKPTPAMPGAILALGFAINGCYVTASVDPAHTSRVNASLAANENQAGSAALNPELHSRLVRLWSDRSNFVAILESDARPERGPRLVSSVPPNYPTALLVADVKGNVLISIVIDEQGKVEAARVLESSDARFDRPSLDAVRAWKFLPATQNGQPTKTFITIPMEFRGKRK